MAKWGVKEKDAEGAKYLAEIFDFICADELKERSKRDKRKGKRSAKKEEVK